ncbi:hypothetical protein IHV25_02155 [Phaeovibrio sulfidiphilus]|uniref:Uncharacterized protein n=1 Tax=Phaeovibrio sulfidiphilus TaxID=1220600 RepID=A0A8J6YNX5_9PROT|nr:hypothetical protein [Phaeovibrio sulfidiphilus]MBE1236457.1 hypothetical protein [Phaeovibrio sulfidiphilus]
MRSKKLLIGLLVLLCLAGTLAIGGSLVAERLVRKKLDSVFASVTRALSPGSRLDYGAFSLHPFSLSASLEDVHLRDPQKGLDVQVDRIRAGMPRFRGRSLDAIDIELRGLSATVSGGQAASVSGGQAASVSGGQAAGASGGKTASGGARASLSLDRLEVDGLRVPPLMDLARNRPAALSGPVFRTLDVGTIVLESLQADLSPAEPKPPRPSAAAPAASPDADAARDVRVALDRLEIDAIRQGQIGTLQADGFSAVRGNADLAVRQLSLSGLEPGRALDWFQRTGGNIYRQARLDVDFFGLSALSVDGIRARLDARPLEIGRFFMVDLDSSSNFPVRMTLGVQGLVLPWALLPDSVREGDIGRYLKANRLTALPISLEWRHALDEDRRLFLFGPMTADLGPLGVFRGRLDLSNVDRGTLSDLAEHQERFINSVKIRGALVELDAGPSTASLIDFALGLGKTTRPELIARFEPGGDIGQSAVLVLGEQRGTQLAGAARSFLQSPARFRFSADAGDGAMDLDTLGLTLSNSARDLARAYNVETTYERTRP